MAGLSCFAAVGGKVEREVARTPRAPAGGLAALLHHLPFQHHGKTEKPDGTARLLHLYCVVYILAVGTISFSVSCVRPFEQGSNTQNCIPIPKGVITHVGRSTYPCSASGS